MYVLYEIQLFPTKGFFITINYNSLRVSIRPQRLQSGFICPSRSSNENITSEDTLRIQISTDTGWSKRGSGFQYDSLNGYTAIIGRESGLVLDYVTCNRKCRLCDKGLI